MILALAFLTLLFLFAVGLTIAGVRSAPEGYQDESGFHHLWCNNTPQTRDVVCIWKTLGEENAVSEADESSQAA
jgi:hypothetical protein